MASTMILEKINYIIIFNKIMNQIIGVLFWIGFAHPNLFGIKGFVVVTLHILVCDYTATQPRNNKIDK
jgi:hypothetical protein